MAEPRTPSIYSIAAHRGFADALVAGLVPRYAEPDIGLARLTLLLPSSRASRAVSEAFIRHMGEAGVAGMLMPRMAVVGDLDLDEALGSLLDPLNDAGIPPAIDPLRRQFALLPLIRKVMGDDAPQGASLLQFAAELAGTMDRLLVEGVKPDELLEPRVLDAVESQAQHWQDSIATFARVQAYWRARLEELGAVDAATRRNLLFDHAARIWRDTPPATPIVAAGVTSAAPSLARLLRVVSELPQGAVILPDFDLTMPDEVWAELGRAGATASPGETPFGKHDAVTHPQYHLKLLLNRMGVAREEVQPWHRKGLGAAPPQRSHAIGALFLPPEASRSWIDMPPEKRRLTGVHVAEAASPEEEAQAVALMVRERLERPEERVAVVTPDRALARRIVQHLERWNIRADDSGGRPLSQTPAGRLLLLLAQVAADDAAPVPLMALLMHPLVDGGMERGRWLRRLRLLERELRGPRLQSGIAAYDHQVAESAQKAPQLPEWWAEVRPRVERLLILRDAPEIALADALAILIEVGEALCGEKLWAREDGRALARRIDEIRAADAESPLTVPSDQLDRVLTGLLESVAVRPPWGGNSRVAIYGLLESRMTRADLVICAGLNEGVWPSPDAVDALLAPPVLRALGVPGSDFRVGLSAHDLAGAMGAPEVVLTRAVRDEGGPRIASRFLLRVEAMLGEQFAYCRDEAIIDLARAMVRAEPAPRYPRPAPMPDADQRKVAISVTALDRLLGDPYEFYAQNILNLRELDALDADPSAAWQGQVAHTIMEEWQKARFAGTPRDIEIVTREVLDARNVSPLMEGLWLPRLSAALR